MLNNKLQQCNILKYYILSKLPVTFKRYLNTFTEYR